MVILMDCTSDPRAVSRLYAEYEMTNENVRNSVNDVRHWMEEQRCFPSVPPGKNDEINFWIEGFLRLTKNSVEKTKIAVESYFKLKFAFPRIFSVKDIPSYVNSRVFDNLNMMLLPTMTEDGLRILLYGPNTEDSSLFHADDFYRRMSLVLDLQQNKGIDFTGIYVIIYCRYGTLGHLAQFDLARLKKIFKLAKKAYPIRLKHTHIIFPPFFLEAAVKIMKPFLSKKVMSRVSIHKNAESLWEHLPKAILPSDLGGNLPSLRDIHEYWKDEILKNYEWFLSNEYFWNKMQMYGGNEEKFEKQGSGFRSLSLD